MTQGYGGFIVPIPLGNAGMMSDFSDVSESPNSLLLLRNVTSRHGYIERAPGSVKTILPALPGAILSFRDFFPNDYTQRIYSLVGNGKVYRSTPWYESVEVPSSDGSEPLLTANQTPVIIQGGAEITGAQRKLFIFSGNNQIQVIPGDSTTRRNMLRPAIDWVPGNYPTCAMVFLGSLWVWGCPKSPSMVFVSNPNDHEDFQTLGAVQTINIFPGDGDRVVDGFAFKGRAYFTKYPRGIYYVDTSGATFFPVKIGDSFGASAPLTSVQAIDDMYIANSAGSITSLKAVFNLGGTEQGDVLKELKNAKFALQYLSGFSNGPKRAIYYENKKQVMIASSTSGTAMNRLYVIDQTTPNPLFFFYDKDNMQSLGLVRDIRGIPKPVYGGSDGFFYDMDSPMRNVGGSQYLSEFQTHNMDFKWVFVGLQTNLEERDKCFDYVGLTFEPTGNWDINCDAYVDGNKKASISFNLSRDRCLDGRFPLDLTSLVGTNTVSKIAPLNCTGKKLRLRFYTSGLNQNFRISAVTMYIRQGGTNNRGG